jgi:hypothetical protein
MSGFPILDLIAGLIFIYFLTSIISSSAVEILLTLANLRAKTLTKWLKTIFSQTVNVPGDTPGTPKTAPLFEAIMDHCALTALSGKGKSTAYIDAKNFATALIEKINFDVNKVVNVVPATLATFCSDLAKTTGLPPDLQRTFLMYAQEATDTWNKLATKTGSEMELFRTKLENWYDSNMDRVGGTLKQKYSRPLTFWLGLAIVFVMNVDSISLAKYLYSNPDARAKLAASAYAEGRNDSLKLSVNLPPADSAKLKTWQDTVNARIQAVNKAKAALSDVIPLGWSQGEFSGYAKSICAKNQPKSPVIMKLLGLLLTTLAVMLGAPFWFDLLNKITNIRGTGAKPASTTDKKKKK